MATLDTLRDEVQTHLQISITDDDVIWAYNEFSSMVDRAMQSRYGASTSAVAVSVPTTGYALSAITDLRNSDIGFKVYKGTDTQDVRAEDILNRIHPAISRTPGYYVMGGSLYVKNIGGTGKATSAVDVVIFYKTKRTAVASGADLTSTTFEWDQDLEFAFKRYLQGVFFDGNFRPENVAEAQAVAKQWLDEFFNEAQTV